MKNINIGLIGNGLMGKVHTHCYQSLTQYCNAPSNLSSILTRSQPLKKTSYTHEFTSIDEFINNDALDLVDICTPNAAHYDAVSLSLKNKKHVYCEKPLCSNTADCAQLVIQANEATVLNQVALVYRFIPSVSILRDLYNSSSIGTLLHFSMSIRHSSYLHRNKDTEWRTNLKDSGGGVMMDLGIHAIDTIRFILGEFDSISCHSASYDKKDDAIHMDDQHIAEDHADCFCLLDNQAVGTIQVSKLSQTSDPEWQISLFGTQGSLCAHADKSNEVILTHLDGSSEVIKTLDGSTYSKHLAMWSSKFPEAREVLPHLASIHSILWQLREDKTVEGVPSFEEALASQLVIDSCYTSIQAHGALVKVKKISEVIHE